jgi:hypothetical protein
MLTRILARLVDGADRYYGPALDVITSQGTAIGASLVATTIASGDSFTIRNCAVTDKVWMLNYWTHNLVAGMSRIRSPKLHDNVDAIRSRALVATLDPVLPLGVRVQFYPQDTEIVELAGSGVGGQIESVVQLMYYENILGPSARLIDYPTLLQRQKTVIGQRLAITLGSTTGYNGARAINGDNDQFHANTDYAVLGISSDINTAAIAIRGVESGNMRAAVPGSILLWQLTERFFVKLSREFGMALIPVFNAANKAGVLVDAVNNQAGGTCNATIWLAELTTP